MKLLFGILILILLTIELITYISLRKFLKKNENELVETVLKGLMLRGIILLAASILIGVLGVMIQLL